ncbi:MAG: capsule assembly Wzi family protein, partial [Candidatus Neomarinimicrobiota bacterium]
KWGPALHSIVISQKAPTYPQFGFEWKPNRRLRFIYTHADLFSGIEDTLQTQSAGLLGERVVHLKRYLATHRAEFSLTPLITLGLTESVVYGGRGMETMYLMPFVLYFSAEHYLGDRDNVLMSADLAVNLKPDLKLYAEFLVDEWRPQETFKETNRNWFAWQGGIDWQSILAPNDRFVLEATWTDHRIYRHRYSANEYYSHEYPVGHWIGPHAQALYAAYDFPFWGSHFMVSFNYAKRGELTKPMLEDQYSSMSYDRFSGKTETLQTINLTIDRKVLPKALPSLWVEIGVSHIRWSNAGFNPFKPEANELGDVTKTSYTLAFYYNFHIPGYDVSFLSPS